MRNIFLLYMPPNNVEAMVHYRDTIEQRVPMQRIAPFLSAELRARLTEVFGDKPIAIWGSRNTDANRRRFDQMAPRDDILIVEGGTIKLLGLIAAKTVNADLSRNLWKNLRGNDAVGWNLIYFIANPREIDLDFASFCHLFGYQQNYQLRGFTSVSPDRLEAFYDRYDDLYDVLVRLKQGESVETGNPAQLTKPPVTVAKDGAVEVAEEDIDQLLQSKEISEHVRMQWTLAKLGLKAGEKVWVPPGDQTKIRKLYEFNQFETRFTSGIDLPTGYFDNIDVIWKEQFRIDAAFEIENSTAIYSGLLRFADLTIVAPNTTYPLFLVAPKERRDQVRKQLERPAFQQFRLSSKVKFLCYEAIEDVDRFFPDLSSGFSVDVIRGKAETLL
jgi:hypothetical protein